MAGRVAGMAEVLNLSGIRSVAVIALLSLTACVHQPLPNLPENWTGEVVIPQELEDKPGIASLQVLIVYGSTVCNHTASRYYCPGKGALFWDPGGGYGTKGIVKVDREKDVIVDNIPSINDYLYWRTQVPTSATEIFVWEGNNEKICELYDRMAAASRRDRIQGFNSDAAGMFCSSATSSFLRDFAQDLMQVEKWGLPHNLSKQFHQRGTADKIYIVDHKTNLIRRFYPNKPTTVTQPVPQITPH